LENTEEKMLPTLYTAEKQMFFLLLKGIQDYTQDSCVLVVSDITEEWGKKCCNPRV